jgi:hypothetical protein
MPAARIKNCRKDAVSFYTSAFRFNVLTTKRAVRVIRINIPEAIVAP